MLNMTALKSLNLVDKINSKLKIYDYKTGGCGIGFRNNKTVRH